MEKSDWLVFGLVLFLGIWLRAPEVLNRNPIFGFDQGRDFLAVSKIVTDKKLTLVGAEAGSGMAGFGGLFHGPYFYYLLVLPFIFFGGDPYGGLVLMFLLGITSLLLGFWITRRFFGVKAGLVVMFLMGLALYAQSRFVWAPHPATPLILLVFWFVFRMFSSPRRSFFWACFLAGLIYGFELGTSIPLLFSLFVYAWLILKNRRWQFWIAGLSGAAMAHLPLVLFEFRHGFWAARGLGRIFFRLFSGQEKMDLASTARNHLLDMWFNFRDTFYLTNFYRWALFFVLVLGSLHYWCRKKQSPQKAFFGFLLVLPMGTYLSFLLLNNVVWGYYLVHLHLAYVFIFAVLLTQSRLFWVKKSLLIILILMTPWVFREIKKAYQDYFDHGGVAKMKGKLEVIDYFYQDAVGKKFNVLVFTPPVYDYAYRYLLSWYGQKKYGFVPGEQKKGLFYCWIEPERGKPWTYRGWLETVVKTGEILDEKELPSGFIVQKRHAEE